MESGLKVAIWQEPPFGSICILIYAERGDKIQVAMPVDLTFNLISRDEMPEPTIRIGMIAADGFLKALAEALDSVGVRTDKDAKIEGTLEATRAHLDDSRWTVRELFKRLPLVITEEEKR